MRGKLNMSKNKIKWENQIVWERNLPDIEYSRACIKERAAAWAVSPRAAQGFKRVPAVMRRELLIHEQHKVQEEYQTPQDLSHKAEINEDQPHHNGNANKKHHAHKDQNIKDQWWSYGNTWNWYTRQEWDTNAPWQDDGIHERVPVSQGSYTNHCQKGPHPRSKQWHQPNEENGQGPKSRRLKKQRSADHPFYNMHRPDNADPEEWKRWVDEAEPDYSEDDERVAITQEQFNDFQWKYNDHRQEAMEPQMPAWIVNHCIRQLKER